MAISRDPANIAALRAAFVASIEAGHSDTSAAGGIGIHPSTIRDWKAQGRQDAEAGLDTPLAAFVADCARANHARISRHLAVVEKAGLSGDAQSSRWLLAAWDRETFGTASKVALTGADGGAVRVEHGPDLSKLSKAELKAMDALLAKASGESSDA